MSAIELDITPLLRASSRLDEALAARAADETNGLYVDATIQRFEFTYEPAHKMIRRYLSLTAANPEEIDAMSFADLIREGGRRGLLKGGWDEWRDYRAARGSTSHTYDEELALRVLAAIPAFVIEVQHLLSQLGERTIPPEAK